MTDGWIKLWRKLLRSSIFGHEGMLKLWILCLLKANHEEAEVLFPGLLSPIKLMPGQFITGRNALHYAYHQGEKNKRYHRKLKPVPKTLFCWLDEMKKIQNLCIKKTNKYSIITISNWPEHQENVQQAYISTDNKSAQTRRVKKNKERTRALFDEMIKLKKRYPDQDLINQTFRSFASTRKKKGTTVRILLSQLEKWECYPVEQVEAGCRVYLQKDYASEGKNEKYLLGIIKNQKAESKQSKQSTGSPRTLTPDEIEDLTTRNE